MFPLSRNGDGMKYDIEINLPDICVSFCLSSVIMEVIAERALANLGVVSLT